MYCPIARRFGQATAANRLDTKITCLGIAGRMTTPAGWLSTEVQGFTLRGSNQKYSYPLGQYASVFQAKLYAILQCARNLNLRPECVKYFTDSHAASRYRFGNAVKIWEYWRADIDRHYWMSWHFECVRHGSQVLYCPWTRSGGTKIIGTEPDQTMGQ